jgi:hypothetical protein
MSVRATAAALLLCSAAACGAAGATATATAPPATDGREPLTADVGDRCRLVVTGQDDEQGGCWQLACAGADLVELGCALSALHDVAQLAASPDHRWLAVVSVGEGHPWLEVVDLRRLLDGRGYEALTEVDPYPGTVLLVGWSADGLRVESDMPLDALPAEGDESVARSDLMFESTRPFRIRVDGWQIERVIEPPRATPRPPPGR